MDSKRAIGSEKEIPFEGLQITNGVEITHSGKFQPPQHSQMSSVAGFLDIALPGGIEAFTKSDFDALEYVAQQRKVIPLTQLQSSVTEELKELRSVLVRLINENYGAFVKVVSELRNVEKLFPSIGSSLSTLDNYTKDINRDFKTLQNEFEVLFRRHTCVVKRRKNKKKVFDTFSLLSQIESNLQKYIEGFGTLELTAGAASNTNNLVSHTAGDFLSNFVTLENCAWDLKRVQLWLSNTDTEPDTHKSLVDDIAAGSALSSTLQDTTSCGVDEIPNSTPNCSEVKTQLNSESHREIEHYAIHFKPAVIKWIYLRGILQSSASNEISLLLDMLKMFPTYIQKALDEEAATTKSDAHSTTEEGQLKSQQANDILPAISQREEFRKAIAALLHLCRAFVAIGDEDTVIKAFNETFFAPVMLKALETIQLDSGGVSRGPLTGKATQNLSSQSTRNETLNFCTFIDILRNELTNKASIVRQVISQMNCELPDVYGEDFLSRNENPICGIPIITNSILIPLISAIEQNFSSVFSPAFPSLFLSNYNAAIKLFDEFYSMLSFNEELKFRRSTQLRAFDAKWKTNVYFSIRQIEASNKLVKAFAQTVTFDQKFLFNDQVFWMISSVEVLRQIRRFVNPDVFISKELFKVLKFFQETFRSYCTHILSILPVIEKSKTPKRNTSRSQISDFDSAVNTNEQFAQKSSEDSDGVMVKPVTDTSKEEATIWSEDTHLVHLGYVISDLLTLLTTLSTNKGYASDKADNASIGSLVVPFLDSIRKLSSTVVESGHTADTNYHFSLLDRENKLTNYIQDIFIFCSQCLIDAKQKIESFLVTKLSQTSNKQMSAIQSIPALYRMTNKLAPSAPSPYVEASLKPLTEFRDASLGVIAEVVLEEWLVQIVNKVCEEFTANATSVLEAVKQQGNSMRRLQRNVIAKSISSPQLSDVGKIQLQIRIDAQYFSSECIHRLQIAEGPSLQLKIMTKAIEAITAEAFIQSKGVVV